MNTGPLWDLLYQDFEHLQRWSFGLGMVFRRDGVNRAQYYDKLSYKRELSYHAYHTNSIVGLTVVWCSPMIFLKTVSMCLYQYTRFLPASDIRKRRPKLGTMMRLRRPEPLAMTNTVEGQDGSHLPTKAPLVVRACGYNCGSAPLHFYSSKLLNLHLSNFISHLTVNQFDLQNTHLW
jgi:hypothetical protein